MTSLSDLARVAAAATPLQFTDIIRYEHGGGRFIRVTPPNPQAERGDQDLVADFYDEANREFYATFNSRMVLALIEAAWVAYTLNAYHPRLKALNDALEKP